MNLQEILEKHKLWLDGEDGGERADLRGTNLEVANLRGANLEGANLRGANLEGANLRGANLREADLQGANLVGTDLRDTNLERANLTEANLRGANLKRVNLTKANLTEANLEGANIDFSCLPLWCGSLQANFDERQAIQILYHLLSIISYSENIGDTVKDKLLTDELMALANNFHLIGECKEIER